MNKIKIVYESTETPEIFEIVRAEYVDGYRIHLWFNTGKEHIVDFSSFLLAYYAASARHVKPNFRLSHAIKKSDRR